MTRSKVNKIITQFAKSVDPFFGKSFVSKHGVIITDVSPFCSHSVNMLTTHWFPAAVKKGNKWFMTTEINALEIWKLRSDNKKKGAAFL